MFSLDRQWSNEGTVNYLILFIGVVHATELCGSQRTTHGSQSVLVVCEIMGASLSLHYVGSRIRLSPSGSAARTLTPLCLFACPNHTL